MLFTVNFLRQQNDIANQVIIFHWLLITFISHVFSYYYYYYYYLSINIAFKSECFCHNLGINFVILMILMIKYYSVEKYKKLIIFLFFLATPPTATDAFPMAFPKGMFLLIKNNKFKESNAIGKLYVNSSICP